VTVARVSGSNGTAQVVEKTTLNGNLSFIFESVVRFIRRYADLEKGTPRKNAGHKGSPIESRRHYHHFAVIEATINALVHRDFAIRDVPTRISVYDDAIEFANPRRTNGFAPPASRAIRFGITQRLNPQIASIFTMREYGTIAPRGGLPMILRDGYKFSGRRVEVYTTNDEFRLKMYGT
jgi:predicted HTH transcriptional regulator